MELLKKKKREKKKNTMSIFTPHPQIPCSLLTHTPCASPALPIPGQTTKDAEPRVWTTLLRLP